MTVRRTRSLTAALLVLAAVAGVDRGAQPQAVLWVQGTSGATLFGGDVVIGDVDGDGVRDLAERSFLPFGSGSYVWMLRSGATGTVLHTFPPNLSTNLGVFFPVGDAGDVDGDGHADVGFGMEDGSGGVFSGRTYQRLYPYPAGVERLVQVGDIDGDGVPDHVLASHSFGGDFILTTVSGASGTPISTFTEATSAFGTHTQLLRIHDFDGDGIDDVAVGLSWTSFPPNPATVSFDYRSPAKLKTVLAHFASPLGSVAVDDVNVDGRTDFADLIRQGTTSTTIDINDGLTGRLLRSIPTAPGETLSSLLLAGDVDGDGAVELVSNLRTTAYPNGAVRLVNAASGRTLLTLPAPPGAETFGVMAGDFDADGDALADLAILASASKQYFLLAYGELASGIASYHPLGVGCTSTVGLPVLAATQGSLPLIGKPFSVQVTNLPPNTPVAMYLGLSNTQWGSVPLPITLTGLGLTGCTLYCSGDLFFPIANLNGNATWSMLVPKNPGRMFWNQALIMDQLANPAGLVLSNASEGNIGY